MVPRRAVVLISIWMVVDLPAPFGEQSDDLLPGGTSKLTLSTARSGRTYSGQVGRTSSATSPRRPRAL